MKTIKYLTSVWMLFSLSILFFSCVDDEFGRGTGLGDGKSIQLNITVPENTVVNPFTKAAQVNSQSVEDLTILVFNNEGKKIKAEYIHDNTLNKLGKEEGASITRSFEVGLGATGFVCVVANADDLSGVEKYETLEAMRFELNQKNPRMVMFASKQNFNVNDASSRVNAELIRIYSMVTVVVQDSTNAAITVKPESLTLYNVPKKGRLIGDNLISVEGESERLGETLSVGASEPSKEWKFDSHEGGSVLYLYENKQPTGYCMIKDGTIDQKDQTSKTPRGFTKPITDTQILMGDIRSSFIEIKAGYLEQGSSVKDGKIKYRFFLGRNAYDDFDVSRNVHYKVTLTLRGNGGVDEATWRVETEKLPNRLNLSDIYVSYLAGSTSELVVTGDVAGIKNVQFKLVDNPNGDAGGFDYSSRKNENGDYVAVVKAQSTNVHYYKNKVGELIFTMNNNKTLKTNVYQVPRLVDPIAIYKNADNVAEKEIEVRRYNEQERKYELLKSIGPWEIEIAGSSDNDWFELRTADGQVIKPSQDKVLTGEGEVKFVYDPLSPNTNPEPRYGKIIVRYHNKWCVHEIYLRQGYQPTQLGNETWSMFNCTGINSQGEPKVTEYPTQSGWLFKGGCNYGMHPFTPGYLQISNNKKIQYSDSDANTYDFTRMDNELNSSIWTDEPQGPCPDGYKVADAYAYRTMVDNAYAYAGFVYDDDPVKGWKYSEVDGNAVLETDNNSCNPAKGIVFIERTGGLKNLFFNFGKGVINGLKDEKLVNEVGVGHRYRGVEFNAPGQPTSDWGWLTVNDCNTEGKLTNNVSPSYGGWYWNSSSFSGTHLGKVDFMYNLFSPTPFDIDVPNDPNDDGINVNSNASFVRCVVDKNPVKRVTINSVFYLVSPKGTNRQLLNNLSPVFTVNGIYAGQLGAANGFISSKLSVPVGTNDAAIVTISLVNYGIPVIVETTLGKLKDPNTVFEFTYSYLPEVVLVDINAKFFWWNGRGEESPLDGTVTFTISTTSTQLEMIKESTGSVANGKLLLPEGTPDNTKVMMQYASPFGPKRLEITLGELRNSGTKVIFKQ